ncbi:hypothetical protein B296_00052564 [Ensete ventricosum]|uniref:Uncharacterized protein n=1 Tax=Ensete ventricosum TaxID=4639 RepID=A0A426YBU9_ENSVE|nr:hypothetical protein B296_00052564 [Ensete ventricosum]
MTTSHVEYSSVSLPSPPLPAPPSAISFRLRIQPGNGRAWRRRWVRPHAVAGLVYCRHLVPLNLPWASCKKLCEQLSFVAVAFLFFLHFCIPSTKLFGPDGKRFEHLSFLNLAQNVDCFFLWSLISKWIADLLLFFGIDRYNLFHFHRLGSDKNCGRGALGGELHYGATGAQTSLIPSVLPWESKPRSISVIPHRQFTIS